MGIFSGPPSIKPPPPPPAPPEPPTPVEPGVRKARKESRRRAALSEGRKSTILTSAQGLSSEAQTTKKTLLGQ